MSETNNLSTVEQELIKKNIAEGFPDLSAQRKQFARKYLESYKPRKAAEAVNLPVGQAHLILKEPLVDAFIELLESHYKERSFLSREMVMLEQMETLEKLQGREAIPMMLRDADGELYEGEGKKFHASETVALLRDLAKQTGAQGTGSSSDSPPGDRVKINLNFGSMGIQESAPVKVAIDGETFGD